MAKTVIAQVVKAATVKEGHLRMGAQVSLSPARFDELKKCGVVDLADAGTEAAAASQKARRVAKK